MDISNCTDLDGASTAALSVSQPSVVRDDVSPKAMMSMGIANDGAGRFTRLHRAIRSKSWVTNRRIRLHRFVDLPGRLYLGPDQPLRACHVLDIWQGGAKLRLDQPGELPETFLLLCDEGTIRRECRPFWQSEDEIGVLFTEAAPRLAIKPMAGALRSSRRE